VKLFTNSDQKQSAGVALANLFSECFKYLKYNVWQSVIVAMALVLSFGFHATHYSHRDRPKDCVNLQCGV
jgi:hypothetical protein